MDAFWAQLNKPKLAPKKSKFRQKKLYLTTVDVEDVESSSLLKMLPKDLHRFQNASEAIQGFKLYRCAYLAAFQDVRYYILVLQYLAFFANGNFGFLPNIVLMV